MLALIAIKIVKVVIALHHALFVKQHIQITTMDHALVVQLLMKKVEHVIIALHHVTVAV